MNKGEILIYENQEGSIKVDVRLEDPPNNVEIAGQSGLSVGAIAADPNQPRACWLWMVADNLRLSAENAVSTARGFLR